MHSADLYPKKAARTLEGLESLGRGAVLQQKFRNAAARLLVPRCCAPPITQTPQFRQRVVSPRSAPKGVQTTMTSTTTTVRRRGGGGVVAVVAVLLLVKDSSESR